VRVETPGRSGCSPVRGEEVKVRKFVACAALFLTVAGCSSSTPDSDLDAWEREVRIITPAQVGERQYEELGGLLEERETVEANLGGEDHAIDVARRRLRRRAAERDADAVVVVECGRHVRPVEGTSLPSGLPEVVCHGVAIRWLD
jgi:hypothetical protein